MQYGLIFITYFFLLVEPCLAYLPTEGNIHYLIGPIFYKNLYKSNAGEPNVPTRNDFSFVVQGDVNSFGSLEISMSHANRDFYRKDDGQFLAEQLEVMKMGMGYRRWFHPSWNFGLILTTTYAMEDPNTIQRNPSNNLLTTSASEISTFGFMGSLEFIPWTSGQNSVVIDIGFERNLTAKPGESRDFMQTMIAFRRFVQSKYPNKFQ